MMLGIYIPERNNSVHYALLETKLFRFFTKVRRPRTWGEFTNLSDLITLCRNHAINNCWGVQFIFISVAKKTTSYPTKISCGKDTAKHIFYALL